MAKENIQIQIDAAVKSAEAAKSLGELKKSLIELNTLQAQLGEDSGPQFDQLASAASKASSQLAETRDKIGDIQDKTRTLEGTPIERLSGSFGLLKESVMNLDFDKAKIGLEGLTNAFTPVVDGKLVTGFAGIKGAMSGLMDGVKNLGSTFMSVGKALLTNPIFLLATAITLIVIGIIKLLDSLGLLKPMLDAIKKAIGFVIDAFHALTDWLGLTTHAQEEQAKSAKENGERQRKEIDATANKQKAYAQLVQGMTEDEIKAFAKKAGIRDDFNKSSFDIEKQRLDATNETLKAEIDALEELQAAGGELTDEQLKELEQRKTDYYNNAEQIKVIEAQKIAAIETMNKNSTATLEAWQIKNIANKNERDRAQLKVEEANEIRKIDIQIAEAKRLGTDYAKLEAAKLEIKKFYANSEQEINKTILKQNADAAKSARDKQKQQAVEALAETERKLQIEVNKYKEGTTERLKAEKDLIDGVLKVQTEKQKTLGILDSQLVILTQEANAKKIKLEQDYANGVFEINKQKVLDAKALAVEQATNDEELLKARRDQIITQAQFDIQQAGITADAMKAIQEKAGKEVAALDQAYADKKAQTALLNKENIVRDLQFELEYGDLSFKEKLKKLEDISKAQKDYAEAEYQNQINQVGLSEAEKALIEDEYRERKKQLDKDAFDQTMALKLEEFNKIADYGQQGLDIAQGFSDAAFITKKQNLDKEMKANMEGLKSGTKAYDEAAMKNFKISQDLARKQFNTNKALQIGGAVIDGFKAITSSLAQSPVAIGPVPNPAGIASLAFAIATSAANIAKIMATNFQEGTAPAATFDAGAGAPSVGGGGEGGAVPAFSPNQFFGLGQTQPQGGEGNAPIEVYVTEGDITGVQKRVAVIEERAILR